MAHGTADICMHGMYQSQYMDVSNVSYDVFYDLIGVGQD